MILELLLTLSSSISITNFSNDFDVVNNNHSEDYSIELVSLPNKDNFSIKIIFEDFIVDFDILDTNYGLNDSVISNQQTSIIFSLSTQQFELNHMHMNVQLMSDETIYASFYSYFKFDNIFISTTGYEDAFYNGLKYGKTNELINNDEIVDLYKEFNNNYVNTESTLSPSRNNTEPLGIDNSPRYIWVSGYVEFEYNQQGDTAPLRGIKIEANGEWSYLGDASEEYNPNFYPTVVSTTTDDNGYFSLKIEFYVDDEYCFELAAYAEGQTFKLYSDVFNMVFQNNCWVSLGIYNYVDKFHAMRVDATIEYNENYLGYKYISMAQAFAYGEMTAINNNIISNNIDKLKIVYPMPFDWLSFSFDGYSGIRASEWSNWQTLIHEYAHYIQVKLGVYDYSVIFNPTHSYDADLISDKNDKSLGIRLSWMESWANIYSLISYDYAVSRFSDVSLYGDFIKMFTDKINECEGLFSKTYSCEAQEYAIVSLLWYVYCNDGVNNSKMNIGSFIDLTTSGNVNTFHDFMVKYYANNSFAKQCEIGEILEQIQLSPKIISVANKTEITFKSGGSQNNPLNKFDIIYTTSSGVGGFTIEDIDIGNDISNTSNFNFSVDQSYIDNWLGNLSISDNKIYVIIAGYNEKDGILTGPYYSAPYIMLYRNPGSITPPGGWQEVGVSG